MAMGESCRRVREAFCATLCNLVFVHLFPVESEKPQGLISPRVMLWSVNMGPFCGGVGGGVEAIWKNKRFEGDETSITSKTYSLNFS